MRSAILAACSFLILGPVHAASGGRVVETHVETFYDGLAITTERLEAGQLVAHVSQGGGEDRAERARLTIDPAAGRGEWFAWDREGRAEAWEVHDYAGAEGGKELAAILEQQTVKSATLSALLLWEDHLAARSPFVETYGQSCPGCHPTSDQCSGWSDSCNGADLRSACNRHDVCYQCGNQCDGTSRAQCDLSFRGEVQGATGSSACARIYWLGVRALGWMFYRDPMGSTPPGDVYSLGLYLTACPPVYYYLCTIYVF
ncbi:MAG TPA: hypothetical protein VF017_23750 [Thermoanaerobaculia bacterium]|nr:hypothetical protein [Thermoanaerobaculia bacterium]